MVLSGPKFFPDPLVQVSGSHDVDVVLNRLDGKVSVHLINSAGPHCTEGILETIPPVGPLQIKVRMDAAPTRLTLQPENRSIPFRYRNGGVECELSELKIYDILVLE